MNLPNSITLLRLALVPVFAFLQLDGRPLAALIVFVAAAASDGIDGFLARALDQRTRFGAILDPFADKLLGLTALLLLVWGGTIPLWLLGVSLLRDAVVFCVGLTAKVTHRPIEAEPTRVSKYATFTLMVTLTLALLASSPRWGEVVGPWLATMGLITAECLVIATSQYLLRWRGVLRRPATA